VLLRLADKGLTIQSNLLAYFKKRKIINCRADIKSNTQVPYFYISFRSILFLTKPLQFMFAMAPVDALDRRTISWPLASRSVIRSKLVHLFESLQVKIGLENAKEIARRVCLHRDSTIPLSPRPRLTR